MARCAHVMSSDYYSIVQYPSEFSYCYYYYWPCTRSFKHVSASFTVCSFNSYLFSCICIHGNIAICQRSGGITEPYFFFFIYFISIWIWIRMRYIAILLATKRTEQKRIIKMGFSYRFSSFLKCGKYIAYGILGRNSHA